MISVLQLALLCVLFRVLDDTSYAAFITAGYLIGLLEIASDYGARLWATREFSVSEVPRTVFHQSVRTKVFYTLLSAALLALLPLNTLSLNGFLLSILIAVSQPGTDPLLWFLRARERLDIEAAVVLASRFAIVLGMAVAAVAGFGLTTLLLIWLLGNLLRMAVETKLAIIQPLFTRSRVSPSPTSRQSFGPSDSTALRTIAAVFPLGTALVLTCIFQRTSLYLLEMHASVRDYNIYATAFKFVNTSGTVATAIFVSSFAPLTKAIASDDTAAIRAVVRRKLVLVTAVFLPACLLGILLIGPLSALQSSESIADVAAVMVLLMPGLYVSCINMGLKYTLNAYELNWQDVTAVIIGIAALYVATIFHGSLSWWYAGAFGWFVGETTLLVSRLSLLRSRQKHDGVPVGVIFGSAAALLLMVMLRR